MTIQKKNASVAYRILFWAGILFIRIIYYLCISPCQMTNDSSWYIDFRTPNWISLSSGNPKPPVYGIIIDVFQLFFPNSYLQWLIFSQILLSFLVLFLFLKTLRNLDINTHLAYTITAVYALSPAVVGWDTCILTESFSLSCTVVLWFCIQMFISNSDIRFGRFSILLIIILVFLRPQFMVYLAILLLYLIIKYFCDPSNRRKWVQLICIELVCGIIIAGYSILFNKEYGIYSLTDASVNQNTIYCIGNGYYQYSDDPEFVQIVSNSLNEPAAEGENIAWKTLNGALKKRYTLSELDRISRQCIRSAGTEFYSDMFDLMIRWSSIPMSGYSFMYSGNYSNMNQNAPQILKDIVAVLRSLFEWVTVGHLLFTSLGCGIGMIYSWLKGNKPPWFLMGLFSAMMCTTFLSFFVTCDEYMRTMISAFPLFYFTLALFLKWCAETTDSGITTENDSSSKTFKE